MLSKQFVKGIRKHFNFPFAVCGASFKFIAVFRKVYGKIPYRKFFPYIILSIQPAPVVQYRRARFQKPGGKRYVSGYGQIAAFGHIRKAVVGGTFFGGAYKHLRIRPLYARYDPVCGKDSRNACASCRP